MHKQRKQNILLMSICIVLLALLAVLCFMHLEKQTEFEKENQIAIQQEEKENESKQAEIASSEAAEAAEIESEQAEIQELAHKSGLDETDGNIVYADYDGFTQEGGELLD